MEPISELRICDRWRSRNAPENSAEDKPRIWPAQFDVCESQNEVVIQVDLPGVDEDEIDVQPSGKELKILAHRDFNHDHDDAEDFTVLQRPFGQMQCVVTLPENADLNRMTAKYRRGVLKVRVPRRAA